MAKHHNLRFDIIWNIVYGATILLMKSSKCIFFENTN